MELQFTLLTIVLIVVLYIPGYFFKRFYFQGKFAKQFGIGLFAERTITSIFWGIIIQLISFKIFSNIFKPNIENIWKKLSTMYTELSNNEIPDMISSGLDINACLVYLLGSLTLSIILGVLAHQIVCIFNIHIKFPVFRFQNEWHYYFNGLTGRSVSNIYKKFRVISTEMDVLVTDGSAENKLYQGLLSDYSISSKTGDLELISLINVKRFSKNRAAFVAVPGDGILIPYDKIININLRFIRVRRRLFLHTRNSYSIFFKKAFEALYLVIFFLLPVVVFYKKYAEIGFWRFLIGTIFMWLSFLILGGMTVVIFPLRNNAAITNKTAVLVFMGIIEAIVASVSLYFLFHS